MPGFDPFAAFEAIKALPMPNDAVSVPAPMPAPISPAAPSLIPQMPDADLPPLPSAIPMKAGKGIDWLQLMKLAAPAIGMLATRGNGGDAAFMEGYSRGSALAEEERLRQEGEAQKKKLASADYLMQIGENALGIDDPVLFDEFMRLADDAGAKAGYTQPGELKNKLTYPQSKLAAARLKELTDRLDQLEKQGYDLDALAQAGSSIELKDGKPIPVASAVELTRRRPVDASGKPIARPKPVAKPDNRDLTESQYDDLVALWKESHPGQEPPASVRTQLRVQAKKQIGQADDRPRITVNTAQPGSLPTAVQRRVDAQAKGFDAQPAVKRAQLAAEAVQFVNSMDLNTQNPSDDQALIYAFAKAMDPESVVREGEYATAQKYAQSWVKSFGKGVEMALAGTGFLSVEARQNMRKTIQAKYRATKTQYDNLRREYGRKINKITGKADGEEYLTDYGGGFPADAPAGSTPTTATPSPSTGGASFQVGRYRVRVKG